MAQRLTVGIDIGTTSTKAVAAGDDGQVVARVRLAHDLHSAHGGELAHPAAVAWREGPQRAWQAVTEQLGPRVGIPAVCVSAMVPSLCAVGPDGVPISDGLLYGDARGAGGPRGVPPSESGELVRFLAALVASHPGAAGYWPAQAVANAALCGVGAIDTTTAMVAVPLFDYTGWDPAVAASAGLDDVARLPRIVRGSEAVGEVLDRPGTLVAGGTVDALGEQVVAGADHPGDVLVIMGATLITWAVIEDWQDTPGLWTVPHTAAGLSLIGGPSNAGGLTMDWARRLVGPAGPDDPLRPASAERVPVLQPYLRGERVPLHDPDRRGALVDLDIGCGPAEVRRAAAESSGFAVRHILDLAGLRPRRIVATGGGTYDDRWLAGLADASGLPVDVVAVAEGAALGAAFAARVTAGMEADLTDARRWAAIARRVEPDPEWAAAAAARYHRYRDLPAGASP